MKTTGFVSWLLVGAIMIPVLTGCKEESKDAATQVAAKVNGKEISVHQVNFLLQRSGATPEQAKAASDQILARLVDQELLVQKALEKKLDRDPAVLQQLEFAKRELLSRAYLEQVGASVAKPSQDEISEYYTQHPELFSQRRVYSFRVLNVMIDKAAQANLQSELVQAKSLEDVAQWLRGQNIKFVGKSDVKAAEQLPLALLPRFHKMQEGQIATFAAPHGVEIVQLVAAKSEPIGKDKATPFIEQFMQTQRHNERAEKEIKDLRASAKLEYMGEFASHTQSEVANATDGRSAAPVELTLPATAASAAAGVADPELSKGVAAGLK